MHKEQEERRDFLPDLIAHLDRLDAGEIVLEGGYGLGVGVPIDAYLDVSGRVRVGSYEECLDQDVVVVLRCPEQEELRRLRPGAVLLSMLHYPTRPDRTALLAELGVRAVSLDAITDRSGRRLVENLEAAFGDMEILHLVEHDSAIEEGAGHKGMSALIDLVARKR